MISKKEWEKSFKNVNGREPKEYEYQKAISDGLVQEELARNKNTSRTIVIVGIIIGILLAIITVILLIIFFYPRPTNNQSSNFNNGSSNSTSDSSVPITKSSSAEDLSETMTEWNNLSLNEQIALLAQAYSGINSQTSILSADKIAMTANGSNGVNDGYIQWYDSDHNQHKLDVRINNNVVTYSYINGLSNLNEQKTTEISSILSSYYQSTATKETIENIASKIVTPSDLEKGETNQDLNIEAIFAGDISSLVGEWRNGKGRTITINTDKTFFVNNDTSRMGRLTIPKLAMDNPYLNVGGALGNSALALFKIGFSNPAGDSSDITKARILVTQQAGNFPVDDYYYRS